jgi:hypothetical protein
MAPVDIEQSNNTTTSSIYWATVRTEEEATYSDAIIFESDTDGSEKNNIKVDDPTESSNAELGSYLLKQH